MRPYRMCSQPTLFTMLQPYWPFISFRIPRLFPPQGPCSWILPLPGMPHTSTWQAPSYYLRFSSKVTWPPLTLLPKSSPPISILWPCSIFFIAHVTIWNYLLHLFVYLFIIYVTPWEVRSMKTNTSPILFTTAFPIYRETPAVWWVLYKYLLNEWMIS